MQNMSRCLSHDLIQYQRDEEAMVLSIADGQDSSQKDLVRQMYEPLKITVDDLNREYSPEDVKQLCLRTKVRVNMTLYNCVWDAKKRFDKKGRLTGRSENFVNAMLVKAVKKKMQLPYTPQEIAKSNHIRQCQLKKDNNARLDRWKHDAKETSEIVDFNQVEPSLLMAQLPNEVVPNSIMETAPAIIYPTSIDTQSQESSINLPESEIDLWIDEDEPEAGEGTGGGAGTESAAAANVLKTDSEVSLISIPDWAQAAAEINTESITNETLDVQSSSPMSSQQVEDYHMFGTQVPSTSTQTPQTEPFI